MYRTPNILVIDDSVDTLNLVKITLTRNLKCEVHQAKSGKAGLEAALKYQPDLILLDIALPDMNGYKVFSAIKSQERFKKVPIIFLSGNVGQQDILMGLKLGAVDYITKPYYPRELLARVSSHLEIFFQKEEILMHSRRNRELLQVLCHDMANHIAGIAGLLFLSERDPSNAVKHNKRMKANVANMTEMISLVRQFRAIEDGKADFQLGPIDLNDAVESSLKTLYQRLADKDIIAKVRIPENLGVKAERTSFVNSVISNLLTNAIKFSYPGREILVEAKLLEGERVSLVVQDQGIGMPQSIVEDLFSMDKATSRPGTDNESGTGYGMPLVKKFVDLYGGDVSVESVENDASASEHGTRITLTLERA